MVTPLSPSPPPLNQTIHGNIMLAAIISLLVVILFVLLLHVYAKWFLGQARYNRRNSPSVTIPGVLGSRFHTFTIDTTFADSTPPKGLESCIIYSIPLFVYKKNQCNYEHGLECVVCISGFEEEEVGRKLPKCGHSFHVDCIDMWLHSHSTCPICRASVVGEDQDKNIVEICSSSEGDDHRPQSTVEIPM